jgi:hypothetical protein
METGTAMLELKELFSTRRVRSRESLANARAGLNQEINAGNWESALVDANLVQIYLNQLIHYDEVVKEIDRVGN